MMFPRVEITIDRDILDAVLDNAQNGPARFNKKLRIKLEGLQARTLTRLHEQPGQPHYPIRWTSDRQRRYVMAKLRRMGNIPYQRTGDFVAAWKTEFTTTADGGLFAVVNTAKTDKGQPLEQYVTGDRQQGFHRDTGWYQSQDVLADVLVEAEDDMINLWWETMRL
jgi:hypothetical protein